jgi:hypothetical protein
VRVSSGGQRGPAVDIERVFVYVYGMGASRKRAHGLASMSRGTSLRTGETVYLLSNGRIAPWFHSALASASASARKTGCGMNSPGDYPFGVCRMGGMASKAS